MTYKMGKIPVAIISDGGDYKAITKYFLRSHFDSFTVSSKDSTSSGFEKGSLRTALEESLKREPESHVVIIKDTTTSNFSADDITIAIKETLGSDLVYLTRWQDRCDLMSVEKDVTLSGGRSIKVVSTYSPKGYQAIVVSPKLRDYLLSKDFVHDKPFERILSDLVYNGTYKAVAFAPNLFEYDIKYAKDMGDYYRLNPCASIASPTSDISKNITVETYVYLTVIVLFFILLGFAMYLLGPSPKVTIRKEGVQYDSRIDTRGSI